MYLYLDRPGTSSGPKIGYLSPHDDELLELEGDELLELEDDELLELEDDELLELDDDEELDEDELSTAIVPPTVRSRPIDAFQRAHQKPSE